MILSLEKSDNIVMSPWKATVPEILALLKVLLVLCRLFLPCLAGLYENDKDRLAMWRGCKCLELSPGEDTTIFDLCRTLKSKDAGLKMDTAGPTGVPGEDEAQRLTVGEVSWETEGGDFVWRRQTMQNILSGSATAQNPAMKSVFTVDNAYNNSLRINRYM